MDSAGSFVLGGLLEVRRAVLSGASDVSRLSTLSWEQFLTYITQLNDKCRELPDSNGKYVIFALKKGTHDSLLWKATVRICAVKMNSRTGKIESRKIMGLAEFLRLQQSLDSLIVPGQAGAEVAGTSTAAAAPVTAGLMDASMIMQKIPSAEMKEELSPEERCCICMERAPEAILPCVHAFCLPCIEQWNMGRKWCPICRQALPSTDDAWLLEDAAAAEELSGYLLSSTKEPSDPRHQPPPDLPTPP